MARDGKRAAWARPTSSVGHGEAAIPTWNGFPMANALAPGRRPCCWRGICGHTRVPVGNEDGRRPGRVMRMAAGRGGRRGRKTEQTWASDEGFLPGRLTGTADMSDDDGGATRTSGSRRLAVVRWPCHHGPRSRRQELRHGCAGGCASRGAG